MFKLPKSVFSLRPTNLTARTSLKSNLVSNFVSNLGVVVLVSDYDGELFFVSRIFFAMLEGGQMGRATRLCAISLHSIRGIHASRLCVLNFDAV
jgi:hypothetical protein